ncbi:MAG TPA: HAD family hydrolase [Gaiellaceae bacterium]|nr:HAD family hydrolase [Gaiellaceae bacterium]
MRAVVFDFGYTLVNEDRVWSEIAGQYGWPESVFFATLGAVIERRGHHGQVLDILGAPHPPESVPFEQRDFYDDALPSVQSIKAAGHLVGIAGNFSAEIESFLQQQADVDFIASSERWGVEKPDPRFFARIADESGCCADEITYVGDRIDNDVLPAAAVGMAAVFLQRGPWAAVQKSWPEAAGATTISDLGSIPV